MSYCPALWSRACAVGTSNTANVAPPIEFSLPYLARPVIVYCRVGPSAATPILSPMAYPLSSAVALSITTCPAPPAQCPAVSVIGLKRSARGSKPKPNWPLLLEPSDSPFLPMSFV